MKPTTLYFALGATQLALCAPISRDLTEPLIELTESARGIATVPREQSTLFRPHTPEADTRETSPLPFLPPVSNYPRLDAASRGRRRGNRKIDAIPLRIPVKEENGSLEVDLGVPADRLSSPAHDMPYPKNISSRERNDTLVVILAAAFVVVVVIMETSWSPFRRCVSLTSVASRWRNPIGRKEISTD
ncbi:hypothetical protein C8A03DRAFT_16643 [Achaetomium macrosporum]|uniref:Uncharacterized protein n=1 Tax=Achaetomium macrosporum TaxID=79813 RepID=A0AAN7C851_9PEZI|nr:hypothetical protein C8A03DRAFT_16643 [Achaetomium macrosporum]